MINKLELNNFAGYKNASFDLERVTCFIGLNDQGKSLGSIVPLQILLANDTFHPSLIKRGETEGSICCHTNDNYLVRTRKGTKQNTILNFEGNEESYSGVKGIDEFTYPVTNLKKVSIVGEQASYINFNFYGESNVLLGCSPVALKRKLSGLLGLEALERGQTYLKSQIRSKEKELKSNTDLLKDVNKKLQEKKAALKLVNELEDCYLKRDFCIKVNQIDRALNLKRELDVLRVILNGLLRQKTYTLKLKLFVLQQILSQIVIDSDTGLEDKVESTTVTYPDNKITTPQEKKETVRICPTCKRPI